MEATGHSNAIPGNARANTSRASRGLIPETLSLLGSVGHHMGALAALAGEEAREAVAIYLRLAVMLATALFFAAFGYTLLLLFIAFLAAMIFHVSWIWVLLALCIIHLIVAFICVAYVKTHWKTPVFTATRGEVARDMDALRGKSL